MIATVFPAPRLKEPSHLLKYVSLLSVWAAIKRNAPPKSGSKERRNWGVQPRRKPDGGEEAEFRMQQGKYLGEYKTYLEERLIIGNCWGREGFRWTPEGKGPF